MEQLIQDFFAKHQAQGALVGLMDLDGNWTLKEIYQGNTKMLIDWNTRFGIASVSKFLTTLCVLICHQKKRLDLDDPIDKYFPEFHDSQVKIRHLLNHTSGFYPQERMLLTDLAFELGIDLKTYDLAHHSEFSAEASARLIQQLKSS